MGKSWRQPKIKDTLHTEEQEWELSGQKLCKPENSGITYLKVLKKITCQPRILYRAKISFKNEGQIKTFLDKRKQRKCISSRSLIQDTLKEII